MWMSLTKERNQISLMMVVLVVVIWSPMIYMSSLDENGEEDDEDIPGNPNLLYSRNKNPMAAALSSLRIEIVAILPDSSNASLSFSKSLNRVLNSVSWEEFMNSDVPANNNERRNITWRVKNFVINSNESVVASGDEGGDHGRKGKKNQTPSSFTSNITFSPQLVPKLCDFLAKTKAIAMIDLVGNVAGEQVLSLVSIAAALPLIGSSQYANPLDTLRKDKDDFYISLSTSVRQVARALGRFLVSCHWHSFTVLFDDTPSVISSQMMWEEELSRMTTNQRFGPQIPNTSQTVPEFYDYDQNPSEMSSGLDYEENGGNDNDPETNPMLKPHFLTMKIRSLNGALRALSQLTKQTQGIVVLLCSDRSLVQVFRAAQKLRMLNGDYVFILVGPHFHFEVIPEWVPSGVLALRGPWRTQIGKYTTKRAGKLLASALHSVKNSKVPLERKQAKRNGEKYFSSPFTSTSFTGSIRDTSSSSGSGKSPSAIRISSHSPTLWDEVPKSKSSSRIRSSPKTIQDLLHNFPNVSCWNMPPHPTRKDVSQVLAREIRSQMERSPQHPSDKRTFVYDRRSLTFDILNLVDIETGESGTTRREWVRVGNVSMDEAHVRTIRWPGGRIFGPGDRQLKSYRVVTTTAPPFVMDADSEDNRTCVIGLPCLKVNTTKNDELAVIFAEYNQGNLEGTSYKLACCDGLAMDLLASISRELKFEVDLFLVPDGYFGARMSDGSWNGLMDVLVTGSAHMSFAPFSVTSVRSTAVDFSTPFFFSAVGFLGMSKNQDVPLMAFLAPFSFELWAAIFLTLNMTALAVALFEWLSPFGLNPWGRQRTKNFSIASALWVVWGRLFSHLVAFKAPKSWPNKFLINVWGGFSVIFVASYTANIAALFAGKFYQRGVDVHDRSLLSQRVAAVKHSATQFYIMRENQQLWEHLQQFPVNGFQEGVNMLKNNTLDLLIGDGPLLDYYRGSDTLCNLIDVSNQDKIGDDTYAVAMTKGFPLKESISTLISKYVGNGYLDYLQGKWYGRLECFHRSSSDLIRARALGIDSVAGMIIMLGVGTLVGILILSMELIVYKFALPYFRKQPKGTIWRSPNIMFFSQKLYRFINCVELVSPHHAAKELVNTLRQGQITSLFQKSVKRKEREQRRRRKSKAQFFEMIQEIRRVQKHERQQSLQHQDSTETRFSTSPPSSSPAPIYSIQARLESNKQTPKVVRILGVDVDIATASNSTFPTVSRSPHQTPSTILEVPEEQSDEDRDDNTEVDALKKRRRLRRRGPEQRVEFKLEPNEKVPSSDEEEGEASASANLNQLTKQQIIHLWKTSEMQLKEQLRKLMKEKDDLNEKVERLRNTKIP